MESDLGGRHGCDGRHEEVVVAHHERAISRAGDMFLKIDADQSNTDAIARAPIPTPDVL
ncbi:hypothetical protein [Nocardia cyriacigeorgica]|uniref:hypothetical protein n=1 Tax=Nocardia cyriacigeorgica TaxID=135487 RepID=UPI002456399A|nr:hypothetical protein [Nocardia cyriacigeorgica]